MCAPLDMAEDESIGTYPATKPTSQIIFQNVTLLDTITEEVAGALNVYYTPLLVFMGFIGNLLSVFVFYNSKLRVQSTSQYLSALALSDTVFLLLLIPPWLNAAQYTGFYVNTGFCQFFVYLSYVSCCLSSWLVVAFTVERFVAVVYPLRRSAVCTVTRARYVIATLTMISLFVNAPVLLFAGPSADDCSINYDFLEHATHFNTVDMVVAFSVPLAIIIFLNFWIMVAVYRLDRARQQMMTEEEPAAAAGIGEQTRAGNPHPRSQQRVTKMLLIVSSIFVILNLPAYALRMIAYANDTKEEVGAVMGALQQLSQLFFHTNFAINFILYCLTGQNFRRALVQAIPCLRSWARRRAARCRAGFPRGARAGSVSTGSYPSIATEATSNCISPTLVCSTSFHGSCAIGRSCNCSHSCIVNVDAAVPGTSHTVLSCTPGPSYRHTASNLCVCKNNTCLTSSTNNLARSIVPVTNCGCAGPSGRSSTPVLCEVCSGRRALNAGYCGPCLNGSQHYCTANCCGAGNATNLPRMSRNVEVGQSHGNRQRSFIKRWTFDNTRQRRQQDIEMQEFNRQDGDL